MAEGKERNTWSDLNAVGVVEEMQRDGEVEHWKTCSELVRWMLDRHFPGLPPHLKEEITQDILLLVHKNLATFQGRSKFTTWLIQITRYRAIDVVRQRKNGQDREVYGDKLPEAHEEETGGMLIATPKMPEELALVAERHREVQALLREFLQLHAKSRRNGRILQLVLYDGYSLEEVAEMLGISAPVVGQVVRAAREYLRQKRHTQDT